MLGTDGLESLFIVGVDGAVLKEINIVLCGQERNLCNLSIRQSL